jgi:hypothetical protein
MEPKGRPPMRRTLSEIDQEIADLRGLLMIMRRIEREESLRERLRTADLDFRMQDLWAGRITGPGLRRALQTLEGLARQPRMS